MVEVQAHGAQDVTDMAWAVSDPIATDITCNAQLLQLKKIACLASKSMVHGLAVMAKAGPFMQSAL